jgi:hypothetical protein
MTSLQDYGKQFDEINKKVAKELLERNGLKHEDFFKEDGTIDWDKVNESGYLIQGIGVSMYDDKGNYDLFQKIDSVKYSVSVPEPTLIIQEGEQDDITES